MSFVLKLWFEHELAVALKLVSCFKFICIKSFAILPLCGSVEVDKFQSVPGILNSPAIIRFEFHSALTSQNVR